MSDELRAAATRLRNHWDGEESCHADEITLAKAWLAEHHADDDLPITREWLLSVGFHTVEGLHENYLHVDGQDYFYVLWGTEAQPFFVPNGDGKPIQEFCYETMTYETVPDITSRRLPDSVNPKTRGRVRRLCRELGIPLNEKASS